MESAEMGLWFVYLAAAFVLGMGAMALLADRHDRPHERPAHH